MAKKTFCLVNLTHKELARDRRGRVILYRGAAPPYDPPAGFRRDQGYSWEPVEDEISRSHTGEPIYLMRDSQVGRVTRIVGPSNQ